MKISEIVEEYNKFKHLTVSVNFINDFPDDSFIEVGMIFPLLSVTKKDARSYVITLDPSTYKMHNLSL